LSDFLFVSARYMAMKANRPEIIYKKPKAITEATKGLLRKE